MRCYLFIVLAALLPLSAAAHTILLLKDTTDLPHPYAQWWYATPTETDLPQNVSEILIHGDGKLGPFFGVLFVNCAEPQFSHWLGSFGGGLSPEDVPVQAIRNLRQEIC
jgi:hypothetical protein